MAAIIKRSASSEEFGLFIDGILLDRASKRLNKRPDFNAIIKTLTNSQIPTVARYYTVIPLEDDSRQRSFLEAVRKAGFGVVVKRLPPVGVERQVSTDTEMASDLIAFAAGKTGFSSNLVVTDEHVESQPMEIKPPEPVGEVLRRTAIVVCPSREMVYPISMAKHLGVTTVSADFAKFSPKGSMKTADRLVDLSTSELIWMKD
jgi:hypothetical protein